jgi:hypothetical protein
LHNNAYLAGILREVIVTKFQTLSLHLLGGTEEMGTVGIPKEILNPVPFE